MANGHGNSATTKPDEPEPNVGLCPTWWAEPTLRMPHSIRLDWETAPVKSLVIPQAGEEANESLREFHVKAGFQLPEKALFPQI